MKILFTIIALLVSCPSFAMKANLSPDISVKLEGAFNFQSGFRRQKLTSTDNNISSFNKNVAFYSDAQIITKITNTSDQLTYGAYIALMPTSKVGRGFGYNGSHIFIINEFGKIEIGSPHDSASKLRISGGDVTAASGCWDRYINLQGEHLKYKTLAPDFVTSEDYFFDSYTTSLKQTNDGTESTRKISYFTPKMYGLQAGISYIPDSTNSGGAAFNTISTGITEIKLDDGRTITLNKHVKDAVSCGIAYEFDIVRELNVKIAISGEHGKAAGDMKISDDIKSYKFSHLKTYNIGAIFAYGGFSYGLSYGDLGKSLTNSQFYKTGRQTRYYNTALAFAQGPIKTSLAYFKSKQYSNDLNAITIGTEYKFAPGLVPYAEITYFRAKGRASYYDEAPHKKTKGTIAIIGAKLKL
jgi:hypothetical protein